MKSSLNSHLRNGRRKMKSFKELLSSSAHHHSLDFASVSLRHGEFTLYLMFDSKDVLVKCGYTGPLNPWMASLCELALEKNLTELKALKLSAWEESFKSDPLFWELFPDMADSLIHFQLELMHACLDLYQGRDYLYREESPLVCRCFGVRERDIIDHLKKTEIATLETLAGESKAGMGCRSCVPQLKRWLTLADPKQGNRYYKERPIADWLVQIDETLKRLPAHESWNLDVKKLKSNQVIITFEKEVSQKEEEQFALELQRFLAGTVDSDLAFFLMRARHFSKANG